MKILLIQPRMNKRPMDTDLKTRMAPSLALLTLMQLTPESHDVTIVNENIERVDDTVNVDFVAITVTLDVMPRACAIAEKFRRRGIPVAAGGIHVTCCHESCLPHFDAICIGAAERVWAKMIEDTASKRLQKVYCDMDGFQGHELVSPKYDAIDKSRYLYTNVVTTSRGCPNQCDFCYNSSKNRLHVRRPIEDVLADIRSLNTRHILFVDDNFIGAPSYTRRLLEEMRGMDLKWNAAVTTRILCIPDLLDLMAETGCQSLFIGFESINNMALEGVNKDNRFELYEALVEAIHSRGIMINASMVFGLDGDGPDAFQNTLNWLVKHKIETLTSHILTPYPGTELYRRMEEAGRITEYDLSKYNTAHVVFRPANMTAEELYNGYLWMYKQFYSFKNIMRRMPVLKQQRKSYLLFNLLYRKFGKLTSALTRMIPMNFIGRLATRISYQLR
ncbi:MAG TPA: B12-binding domain-containing radical SAM protein [Feifaniaceae bacterium]|nr:B12-binding domain-containing radical SAM protein [Feifaniaceae bacterium]